MWPKMLDAVIFLHSDLGPRTPLPLQHLDLGFFLRLLLLLSLTLLLSMLFLLLSTLLFGILSMVVGALLVENSQRTATEVENINCGAKIVPKMTLLLRPLLAVSFVLCRQNEGQLVR